ncbi:MAG: hypothetical protein J0J05_03475 [Microbacterium sp.]|uniref:hypothetical protein n=1 Tax=Microbacterium sp. TaxID=51671 RepID=UPI001AD5FCBA|nr:hypothetical protein [Microbacterium sp.]MBN9153028.1 hypothetical protein [Microbacterium sp.]
MNRPLTTVRRIDPADVSLPATRPVDLTDIVRSRLEYRMPAIDRDRILETPATRVASATGRVARAAG